MEVIKYPAKGRVGGGEVLTYIQIGSKKTIFLKKLRKLKIFTSGFINAHHSTYFSRIYVKNTNFKILNLELLKNLNIFIYKNK
jgi:hypothetical protein